MKLSDRLTAVADMVSIGSRVADIGCDHAYTSIYLIERKIAKKAIAMDINRGPLERARENIKQHGYENAIEVRLSDGARALMPKEADTLLLSGMGGILMNKILSDSIEVVKAAAELVLQPQSELALVRRYVHELGFSIERESMVLEDGKYYTAVKAVNGKGKRREAYTKEIFYRYGKLLLEERNPVLQKFLEQGKASFETILQEISNQQSEKAKRRLAELKEERLYLEEALAYYRGSRE